MRMSLSGFADRASSYIDIALTEAGCVKYNAQQAYWEWEFVNDADVVRAS